MEFDAEESFPAWQIANLTRQRRSRGVPQLQRVPDDL